MHIKVCIPLYTLTFYIPCSDLESVLGGDETLPLQEHATNSESNTCEGKDTLEQPFDQESWPEKSS